MSKKNLKDFSPIIIPLLYFTVFNLFYVLRLQQEDIFTFRTIILFKSFLLIIIPTSTDTFYEYYLISFISG